MKNNNMWEIKLSQLKEQKEASACLKIIIDSPELQHATFMFIKSKPSQFSAPFVRTTYPIDWVDYYLQHNLIETDPVIRHSWKTEDPFYWADIRLSSKEDILMSKAMDHGLSPIGYSIPTLDVGPYKGLLSLTSNFKHNQQWQDFIEPDKTQWIKLAHIIHRIARNEVDPNEDYVHNLSKRELECLKLIADGKTHSEIASILEISGHTVRGYFRSLRLKLNCSTIAHAVAKAKAVRMI
jgi:DNA-binding CsgD family transcriptional regulator